MYSEYVALFTACTSIIWLKNLMTELNLILKPFIIYEDNQSCVSYKTPKFSKVSRFIKLKFHMVRELLDSNVIELRY